MSITNFFIKFIDHRQQSLTQTKVRYALIFLSTLVDLYNLFSLKILEIRIHFNAFVKEISNEVLIFSIEDL